MLDVNEWNVFKVKKNNNIKLFSLIEPTAVSFNIFKSLNKDLVGVNDILILGAGFIGQIVSRIINTYRKK